jgi:hypothetical protein
MSHRARRLSLVLPFVCCAATAQADPLASARKPNAEVHSQWMRAQPGSFQLGAHVVDPSSGKLFANESLDPQQQGPVAAQVKLGIAAIEIRSGRIGWRSAEPLIPIGVEGGALVVVSEKGEILLRAPSTGAPLGRCDVAVAPPSSHYAHKATVNIYREAGQTFLIAAQTSSYAGGQAPPRGTPLTQTNEQIYRLRIAAGSCATERGAIDTTRPPDFEIRRRTRGELAELAFARVGDPPSIELRLGQGPAGIADAFGTPDGAHLVFESPRDAATIRLVVWRIFDRARVGEVSIPPAARGYAVVGPALLLASQSELRAIDLASGKEQWNHALRPRLHRAEPLPPAMPAPPRNL